MRRLGCLIAVGLATVAFVDMGNTPASAAHPQLHRACTNTLLGHYYVGVGHVNCRFAVSSARRMIQGGAKPKGWRCAVFSGRLFGTCKSRGPIFHWAGAE
jgi:hypothetical protein